MSWVVQYPDELAAIRKRWAGAKRTRALGVFVAVCVESRDGPATFDAVASFGGLRLPTTRRYLDDLAALGVVVIQRGVCFPAAFR